MLDVELIKQRSRNSNNVEAKFDDNLFRFNAPSSFHVFSVNSIEMPNR